MLRFALFASHIGVHSIAKDLKAIKAENAGLEDEYKAKKAERKSKAKG